MPRASRMTLAAAIAALLAFAVPAHAADGDLDPSFGGDGVVEPNVPDSYNVIATAVQPDGRIVAAANTPLEAIWVGRFLPNGDPDPSFDGDGHRLYGTPLDSVEALELQPDGRIVLLGSPDPSGDGLDVTVARLLPDGSFDSSFGTGGITRFDFAGTNASSPGALAIQPNGRIVIAGTASSGEGGRVSDVGIARLTAAGALDGTFSGDGRVTEDLGGDVEAAVAVALQGSRIVVAAGTNRARTVEGGSWHFAALALTGSGARDTSFGGDGLTTAQIEGSPSFVNDMIRTQDGQLLLVGNTGASAWAFLKLNGAGNPDTNFDGDGTKTVSLSSESELAISATTTADGRVAVLGAVGQRLAIVKFTLTGNPVTSFGDGGSRIYDITGIPGEIARQPDGKLVFGSARDFDVRLARVHDDGSDPNQPQPLPVLNLTGGTAAEGQVLPFTATLSRPTDQPVTFNYITGEGSAATDRDFGGRRGSATIPAGQTSVTIGIPTNSDRLFENDEIFRVELSDPQNARFGEYVAFGTITNVLRSGRCQNVVRGSGRTDVLTGSPAGDLITGRVDIDFLFGLAGDDCIFGEKGGDIIDGGDGDDVVDGGSGDDRIRGGDGNDRLYGRRGINRYDGGPGNDRIYSRNGRSEIVECGPGRDVVKADRKDRLRRCEIAVR